MSARKTSVYCLNPNLRVTSTSNVDNQDRSRVRIDEFPTTAVSRAKFDDVYRFIALLLPHSVARTGLEHVISIGYVHVGTILEFSCVPSELPTFLNHCAFR